MADKLKAEGKTDAEVVSRVRSILKEKNKVQSVLVTLFISAVLFGLIYYNYGMSQCLSCMA